MPQIFLKYLLNQQIKTRFDREDGKNRSMGQVKIGFLSCAARRILLLAGAVLRRKRRTQKSCLTLCFVFCIITPLFWGGCCAQPARDAWQKMRSLVMQLPSSFLDRITSPRSHSYAHRKPNHSPISKEHFFSPLPKAASLPLHGKSPSRLDSSVRCLPCKTKFLPVHHTLFASSVFGILFTLEMSTIAAFLDLHDKYVLI